MRHGQPLPAPVWFADDPDLWNGLSMNLNDQLGRCKCEGVCECDEHEKENT